MTGTIKINGKDAYETWGITMQQSALSALMTPAGVKEGVVNESRLQHGRRYADSPIRLQERSITLSLQFSANTSSQFFSRYASFCAELETGKLNITTKYQPETEYKLLYNSCSQFSEFMRGIAKFTLRVTEPNPKDRELDRNA